MTDKSIRVDSKVIEISNSDKVLFPDEKITKGEFIDYYLRIADRMLPHLIGHPISMHRFPDGIQKEGFFQKEAPEYFPEWITRVSVEVKDRDDRQEQIVCDNSATLVYLANQACITPHAWLSKVDRLNYPVKMIFDLDPNGEDFEPVRSAAHALRQILEEVGLAAFLMTTGSRGLHILVPLQGSDDFDKVRRFAQDLVKILARREPERFTTETRKNQRRGRLFLDYLRNSYAQTSVPAYAVRAKPGAPVATPLDWDELFNNKLDPQRYNIKNIFRRLSQKSDPWEGMEKYTPGAGPAGLARH
jgi:bifunctional non-homologous end joining protein LigD